MESKDKKNKAEDVIESASSIGGTIAGGMIGLAGGPAGVVLGAITGIGVEKLLALAGVQLYILMELDKIPLDDIAFKIMATLT